MKERKPVKKRTDQKARKGKPEILRSAKTSRGAKPNTCRFCAGSKFC